MSNVVTTIGSEFITYAGGTPSRANPDFFSGEIPWVKSTECNYREINKTEEFISQQALAQSSAKLVPPNSVLVAMYGATAGQISYLNIEATTNQAVLSIIPNQNWNPKFIYYWLNFRKEKLIFLAQGSGQPNLNKAIVDSTELPSFDVSEQQKIAKILTSIDEQIETTEKLIEKKKQIKKGLVQDLIYTKKFDTPIFEVVDILDNLRIPVNDEERQRRGGSIPYYGANGPQGFIDKPLFNEPLILMAEDGGNFEQFADRPIAYRISGPSWVNNHAHIIRAKNYHHDYLFYALEHMNILNLISGGTRAKLNQGELRKIRVPTVDLDEQERVASLINLVVNEINELFDLKDKLIIQKQGLMQDLLTGRVRVN